MAEVVTTLTHRLGNWQLDTSSHQFLYQNTEQRDRKKKSYTVFPSHVDVEERSSHSVTRFGYF